MERRARSTLICRGSGRTARWRSCPHHARVSGAACLVADVVARDTHDATRIRTPRQRRSNKMKIVLALAVGASAFGGFGKSAAPAPSRGGQVAQGGQTVTNIQVPKIFTTAFGDPGRLQERAARAEAKKAEAEAQSAPVRRSSPRATYRVVATALHTGSSPRRRASLSRSAARTSSPSAAPSASKSGSGATSSSPRRARTRATTARATSSTTASRSSSAPRSSRAARPT